MENNIIKVQVVGVSYGDAEILKNINFNVKKGEIFLIVGGSGCGKSTLLRQLIGLEKPTLGSIWVDDTELSSARGKDRKTVLQKFGVLFQSGGLFASMTLAENVALPLRTYTDLDDDSIYDIVKMKLGSVGLTGYDEYLPAEISGGMKKRAGIARAMALDPDILFLDEPSSGLDPVTAAALDQMIIEINAGAGTTVVAVSHDLESIKTIADSIIMLDKVSKGIIASGTLSDLQALEEPPVVHKFFNRKV